MPDVVSGNTNAPAMMIGERGADFVKEDNANKGQSPKPNRARRYRQNSHGFQ